jgi:acetyl-CoA acetyltransferase family protein
MRAGAFAQELVPVEVPAASKRASAVVVKEDEGPRADSSLEKLRALKPVFREGGSVTAGNASGLNDGASAVLLMSERALNGRATLARFVSSGTAGVDPRVMGIGPVPATRKALAAAGWSVAHLEMIELNEAFASQSLACIRELGLNQATVNVNGGAIALGHPLGMSGARIVTTLLHAMRARGARRGLATMCIGVGQGIAATFEAP